MSTPYLGQLSLQAFGYAAKGYALCNGQLLPVNQNQALFSLLGTTYGGDGRNTFALPNLQGRIALGTSTSFPLGSVMGTENVTLLAPQMAAHSHNLTVSTLNTGQSDVMLGNTVGGTKAGVAGTFSNATNVLMNPAALSTAGASQPHENRSPFLTLCWVIALQGIFPSRN